MSMGVQHRARSAQAQQMHRGALRVLNRRRALTVAEVDAVGRKDTVTRVRALTTTALVALAASLLLIASAEAAPGDFDSTFSGDGKEMTDFGKNDSASGVVLQPDGKIVVAGSSGLEVTQCGENGCVSESHADSALARYNPDGTLDTSFSGDGKDTMDFGAASDVALQPDGKIVVVGTEGFSTCGDIWCDTFAEFAVARYNADGTLDTSFSGDGKEMTDFGKTDSASGVVLQPDGKIVVAGSSVDPSGNGADDFALARYNADGTLDASFSDDGKQVTDFGGSDKGAHGLALQPDGKIVAVGGTSGDDFALARYAVDGSLDRTFSDDGKQTTDLAGWDQGRAVAIQDDDKIVVAGTTNRGAFVGDDDFALTRYNADGSLDTTFSGDGKQNTNFGIREHDSANGIALQRDGKIVAVGSSTAGGDTGFALARYAADGSLDTSFSSDGMQHTDFGHAASEVALQPDGKMVAAGPGGGDFALARYEGGTGPPDTTPPDTTLTGAPAGETNDNTPTFTFSSNETGSTFECRVDGGAFSPCNSPHTTAAQSDGSHTFEVRAIDPAGNPDPSPASHGFTVDTTPPQTTTTGGPSGTTKDDTPTFTFSSSEAGSTFECRVDGSALSSCTSPHTTASLSQGSHTFYVQATDSAGNVDPTPAPRSFTVSRKRPAATHAP
jgi:uncharacterized delta-60 repeat protein